MPVAFLILFGLISSCGPQHLLGFTTAFSAVSCVGCAPRGVRHPRVGLGEHAYPRVFCGFGVGVRPRSSADPRLCSSRLAWSSLRCLSLAIRVPLVVYAAMG